MIGELVTERNFVIYLGFHRHALFIPQFYSF